MMNRRIVALGLPWLLAGCAGSRLDLGQSFGLDIGPGGIYGAVDDEPFPVPPIDLRRINPNFLRREVAYNSDERPGTVIVDPSARYAYVVEGEGRAIRYGVGVGKTEAFNFRGTAIIGRKSKWPDWTPTAAMIAREPERYGPYAGGLSGRLEQSARTAGVISLFTWRRHALPAARHYSAMDDRHHGVVWLHSLHQPGHRRSLRPRPGRLESDRAARRRKHRSWMTDREFGAPSIFVMVARSSQIDRLASISLAVAVVRARIRLDSGLLAMRAEHACMHDPGT